MAQKFLLICLITFTGRVLQPASVIPFFSIKAGKRHVFFNSAKAPHCKFELSEDVSAYKSYNCYRKRNSRNTIPDEKLTMVFSAAKKRKPQRRGSVAFLFIPLKNWGTLYFERD